MLLLLHYLSHFHIIMSRFCLKYISSYNVAFYDWAWIPCKIEMARPQNGPSPTLRMPSERMQHFQTQINY